MTRSRRIAFLMAVLPVVLGSAVTAAPPAKPGTSRYAGAGGGCPGAPGWSGSLADQYSFDSQHRLSVG